MLSTIALLSCFGPVGWQDADGALFREDGAAALAGIETVCGSDAKDYIIEVNGGGLALGDFDRDGDLDLVVVNGSTLERIGKGEPGFASRLLKNDGTGHFSDAGDVGLGSGRWGMGVAAGDINGDGFLDLVITEWGRDRVLLNRAGERFEDVTEKAGLRGKSWSTSAALFDYDGDGRLDLAIAGYLRFVEDEIDSRSDGSCRWKGHPVMCGPEGLIPLHDRLYRGLGDGTFEDASRAAGFRPAEAGFGLGMIPFDYGGDGDTDLYVTNDSTPNHLWENQGDGTFQDIGFRRGAAVDGSGKEQAGMGIAAGDVNGDGRPDLFVTNFSGESNALYTSRGKFYRERADATGLGGPSKTDLGWGTAMADFDLDGDLDVAVFNGHVYPQADGAGTDSSYAQRDRLFLNDGGKFVAVPLSDGPPGVSRACAAGDVDGDGDIDLVAIEMNGAVRLLRNRTRNAESDAGPHWLTVRLVGRGANTQAVGAQVTATSASGKQSAFIHTSGGFQASIAAEASFGLGAVESLERLDILWPDGVQQTLENVELNRVLVVEAPVGDDSDAVESVSREDA